MMDKAYIKTICQIGRGAETCSFLIAGANGFECAKGTGLEQAINERRETKAMNALGDNCSGPPEFKPVVA